MKSLICAELHWLQLSLKKGRGNSKVRLHHHHPKMLMQNHHQCCLQCVSLVWLTFSFPLLNFYRNIPKYPKTKNGTERLKCGMLFLRIKIIWLKFQFHRYCLQCISVPNLTLKEVGGGGVWGGRRVVSNRDAKCKLWRANTTSSASSFFLASATVLTSLPSVFDLFV